MALYDSADLLARSIAQAGRPETDEGMGAPAWYSLLTEAQTYWNEELAAHVPEANMTEPQLLESEDGGYTYPLPGEPVGAVQVRESRSGRILRTGAEWDSGTDFVMEGQLLRIPNGQSRTFADGPYVRYVPVTGEIAADSEPTIMPTRVRILLVHRACVLWASKGGRQNPNHYLDLEKSAWNGRPDDRSGAGLLASLKKTYQSGYGRGGSGGRWWNSPDLGR